MNVNQYIENRPKEWFSQDNVVTDLTVVNVDLANHGLAVERYKRVRNLLESRKMYVGTYISGTTVTPESEHTNYPPTTVSIEQMSPNAHYFGSWPKEPNRKIIDVGDADTRHAFQAGIKQLWESVPAPIRFVDNAAAHSSTGRGQPWEAYCKNMEEIRKMGESVGSRVIFNVSLHVGMLSDEETRQLMQAVGNGGIALEMPWHPAIRQSSQATRGAERRYRQLLDNGMGIIMIPADTTPENVLRDWVITWRKPTDHLYLSGVFWKPPDMTIYGLQ